MTAVTDPGPLSRRYIAFGDSLTWGVGDENESDGTGYPDALAALIRRAVYNEGFPGETTDRGEQRISDALAAHPDAEYVLIMEGANDLKNQYPYDDSVAAVRAMTLICLGNRRVPVVMAIPPTQDGYMGWIIELNARYRAFCEENDILFIEGYFDKLRYRPDVLEENWVHLNDLGYEIMAQDIAEELLCNDYYQ